MDAETTTRRAARVTAEVEALYNHDPRRLAARIRPQVEREKERWRVGETKTGVTGTGWTLEQALERWEANYREATTAQQ